MTKSTEAEIFFFNICARLYFDNSISMKIFEKYNEKHRYYHNLEHISNILGLIQCSAFNSMEEKVLRLAAIFHDVIYDPKSGTNEEDSVDFMMRLMKDSISMEVLEEVKGIILATKKHDKFNTELEKTFCKFDLNGFEQSFNSILLDEKKIRKEYAWVDWGEYQASRPKILGHFLNSQILTKEAKENIKFEIEYLQTCLPNIAVYPGSFAPFHLGHLNILHKAEQIFEKVIVAVGNNPEKSLKAHVYKDNLCETLKYHQVDYYNGFLTDYIKLKPYPLTVIRGLRNTVDLQFELNQYRFLQEMSENQIKMVSIFCDKEFEHVSSSAIRSIEKFGGDISKYIVN